MAEVLVVDDDPVARHAVHDLLSSRGHVVHQAADWPRLRDLLFAERVAVVVMDVRMPGTSGDVLADILRRNLDPRPRVVLHSVLPEEELRRLARKVQAEGHVTKGSGEERLIAAVEAGIAAYEAEYLRGDPLTTDPVPRPLPRRVLVAEDSRSRRYWLGEWLRERGLQPILTADGAAALAALERLRDDELPVLVLTDLHMPRMDGARLLEALRSTPRLAGLEAILYSTSLADADSYAEGELAHHRDLSRGAVDFDDLLVLLELRFGGSSVPAERAAPGR